MSKAVLILDEMPAKCLVCNFRGIRDCHCCFAENASIPRMIDDIYSRPDWCPLRLLPKTKWFDDSLYFSNDDYVTEDIEANLMVFGWNRCCEYLATGKDKLEPEIAELWRGDDNNARDN